MPKGATGGGNEALPKYEFAGHWHLADVKGRGLVTMLAGGTCIFGLALILGVVARGMLQGSGDFHVSVFLAFPIFLGIIAATMVLHEAVHGFVFLVFGGKPHFGVKLIGGFFPVVYASATGPFSPRNHYLLVGLAPFLALTLLFLLTGILVRDDSIALIAITAMAMNIAGSTGDLIVARKVQQLGGGTLFEDTTDGFNWYRPSKPDL
ncbi:DUF3267 domain-containing protein [Chloroflexota bacterium]